MSQYGKHQRSKLSFNRCLVAASALVTRRKNTIHSFTEDAMSMAQSTNKKMVKTDDGFELLESLRHKVSFGHDIVDGAPAERFVNRLSERINTAHVLSDDNKINELYESI